MGRMKDAMIDCLEFGVVPVDPGSVGLWAERLGEDAGILDGMPMRHAVDCRGGVIELDVIPISVAESVGALLPDTFDSLGWMIECFRESQL